jgi:spermidine synthase
VIIVDLPDPTSKIISDLYTVEFYLLLKRSLEDDGVFVCQAHSLELTPVVYWSIGKTIEGAGFQTLSYHTLVPSFGDWGFHLGSKKPILWGEKQVRVPTRTLPAKLEYLAYFSPRMLEKKKLAIVNSRKNSILHII